MLATSRHYLGATGGLTAIKVVSLSVFAFVVKAVWAVSRVLGKLMLGARSIRFSYDSLGGLVMLASGKHGTKLCMSDEERLLTKSCISLAAVALNLILT